LGFLYGLSTPPRKPVAYRLIHQSNRRAKDLNSGFFMYELSIPTIENSSFSAYSSNYEKIQSVNIGFF
jgi:hypothetical protein